MAKKQKPLNDPLQAIDFSALDGTLLSGMAKPQTHPASKQGISATGKLRQNEGGWYDVPLEFIEEDPNQPRKDEDFDPVKLEELANSISSTGLSQPISIRVHPTKPDMYMIHTGARRFRAFHLLKRKTIPATFTKTASKAGQIVENHQREPLKPRAMLEYIAESQAEGIKLNEIANRIGVGASYISMFKKILDTKIDEIHLAFDQERFTNITPAYDLLTLAKNHEKEVREYLANFLATEEGEITRGMVKNLKKRIENPDRKTDQVTNPPTTPVQQFSEAGEGGAGGDTREPSQEEQDEGQDAPYSINEDTDNTREPKTEDTGEEPEDEAKPNVPQSKPAKVHIIGELDGEQVIILTKPPSNKTKAVVKLGSGEEKEVPIKNLTLLRIWPE